MFGQAARYGWRCLTQPVQDWQRTLRYGGLPSLVMLLLPLLFWPDQPDTDEIPTADWPLVLVNMLVTYWASLIVQVRWCRHVLLGDDGPAWWAADPNGRTLRVAGWMALLSAIVGVVALLGFLALKITPAVFGRDGFGMAVAVLAAAATLISVFYVLLALSPVVAAVSVDRPGRLGDTVAVMGPSVVFPMMLAATVCTVLPQLADKLIERLASSLLGGLGPEAALSLATVMALPVTYAVALVTGASFAILVAGVYRDHVGSTLALSPATDAVPAAR